MIGLQLRAESADPARWTGAILQEINEETQASPASRRILAVMPKFFIAAPQQVLSDAGYVVLYFQGHYNAQSGRSTCTLQVERHGTGYRLRADRPDHCGRPVDRFVDPGLAGRFREVVAQPGTLHPPSPFRSVVLPLRDGGSDEAADPPHRTNSFMHGGYWWDDQTVESIKGIARFGFAT